MENKYTPPVEKITQILLANSASVRYGDVSVTLRIHNGRIVAVIHTVTHSTRNDHSCLDIQGGDDDGSK